MSLLHFLRDMWAALAVPGPLRPRCTCDASCPVHDPEKATTDV